MAETVANILAATADGDIALVAPGRAPLDHGSLLAHVAATVADLNGRGIGRDDRVAIVLPNGPEMASAFLAVAAGAITAPLNPTYTADEFAFYLDDLAPAALLVEAGSTSPAIAAARDRSIPLLEITSDDDGTAGLFSIAGESSGAGIGNGGPAAADDDALILHTSGTTSRPKLVPLSQANICASARHIRDSLALTTADRCLNVMPLFHIHGLMAAVLASMTAGASVFCCPGFNALSVFAWLKEANASWYTAVPTMHQTILARAERNRDVIANLDLRFVRSSSASLPPQVMAALEETFGAPVIEAYGMTEAAHQMASNPLPPAPRKPGSVGIAAGPEVAVMDDGGTLLASGAKGEVVIRGPDVFAGYANNPDATAEAFTDGWFRTGDQGIIDGDGYLTLTGRLKEIINRGGEKVSPREVDEVLMDHPAVAQVVTFAMPHDKLGEEVAAAVVLAPDASSEDGKVEQDLRAFAGERLAAFKVPRKIVILEDIPKGATGKLQRIGLAEKLGLT
jgi:acyl-CoA synthetase (AMP-forming)/AMP-acid ligase II